MEYIVTVIMPVGSSTTAYPADKKAEAMRAWSDHMDAGHCAVLMPRSSSTRDSLVRQDLEQEVPRALSHALGL